MLSRAPSTPEGWVGKVLAWPLFLLASWCIVVELGLYVVLRVLVVGYEALTKRNKDLLDVLADADSYEQFCTAAARLDEAVQPQTPPTPRTEAYDAELLATCTTRLTTATQHVSAAQRQGGRPLAKALGNLVDVLKDVCVSNLGGRDCELLYCNFQGRNDTITRYVDATVEALDVLSASALPVQDKLSVFSSLSRSYGKSALCLSGGAGNGFYHLGVVKCLLEAGMLPAVVSGSSAGSLIGALVCTRTDDELRHALTPEYLSSVMKACEGSYLSKLFRFLETGYAFDAGDWKRKLSGVLGDATFKEAFDRTGRILNVTVFDGSRHSQVLNHITAPSVVIYSAVMASSSIPHLLPAQQLLVKKADGVVKPHHALGKFWRDGSIKGDLPQRQLQHTFTIHYTIVSQVEPHVIPWINYENRGSAGQPTMHRRGGGWRGGFVSSFAEHLLRLDIKKWLKILRDFQLMPNWFGADFSHLFLQDMTGTCTIVGPYHVSDLAKLLKDPDVEEMKRYIREGERQTWPKLTMLSNQRRIELALQQHLGEVENEGVPSSSRLE